MSRSSKRWTLAVVAIAASLAALEIGLNRLLGSRVAVEIVNEGADPIEDLVATFGAERVPVPKIRSGESAVVRLSDRGEGPGTLSLKFRQRGNALGTFEMPGFDPGDLRRNRMKQVLRIRTNEIERYLDDDDAPATPAGRLVQSAQDRLQGSVDEMARPR